MMAEVIKSGIKINWYESEKGWGIRPDGYSLHLSLDDGEKFIRDYWSRMPARIPNEYSFPGEGRERINISEAVFKMLEAGKENGESGIRFYK